MSDPTRAARRGRTPGRSWLLPLVCALAILLPVAAAASAQEVLPETRVGAETSPQVIHAGGELELTRNLQQGDSIPPCDLTSGSLLAARGGFTLPGGSPGRLAATEGQLVVLTDDIINLAGSATFVRRARALGFSDSAIRSLPGHIYNLRRSGGIGFIRSGGWADETSLLIGRGGVFGPSSRIRHEHGHVLHEIAAPGLMAGTSTWRGSYRAEMVAFGTQLGRFNPARPWLAAYTATMNRYGNLAGSGSSGQPSTASGRGHLPLGAGLLTTRDWGTHDKEIAVAVVALVAAFTFPMGWRTCLVAVVVATVILIWRLRFADDFA